MNDFHSVRSYAKTDRIDLSLVAECAYVYITGGSGVLTCGEVKKPLVKGIAVFVPRGGVITSEQGVAAIAVFLKNADLPNRIITIADNEELSVLRTFAEIGRFNARSIKKRALIIKSLCSLLTAYFVCFSGDEGDSAVVTIKAVINENYYYTAFRIDEYLKSLPFSYDYLRKAFKKEMGLTPLEYLTQKRIDLAKRMLVSDHNGHSISQIAEKCGFKDALYFSKTFKKYVGVSPREFLKNNCDNLKNNG